MKVVIKGQEEVKDYNIVHFLEEGTEETEELKGEGQKDEEGASTEFTTDSFSMYAARDAGIVEMTVDETYPLELRFLNGSITVGEDWLKSSDPACAEIVCEMKDGAPENIYISARVPGTATISCIAPDGYELKKFQVNIKAKDSPSPDDPDEPSDPELEHHKYIKYDPDQDSYELSLDVVGKVETAKSKPKYDILFVVDRSGTMNSRLEQAKEAINNLANSLSGEETAIDARYNLIAYGTTANSPTGWGDSQKLSTGVGQLYPNGETNIEAAFEKAASAFEGGSGTRKGARKVVILLTDAAPTRCNCSGKDQDGAAVYEHTIAAVEKVTCDYFYAICYGDQNEVVVDWADLKKTRENVMDDIKTAIQAPSQNKIVKINSDSSLNDFFEGIAETINSFACTQVKITDTLSDYIAVTQESRLQITVADEKGNPVGPSALSKNFGSDETMNTEWKLAERTVGTARYDKEKKTATLEFASEYELEDGYTYTIHMTNLEAAPKAYTEYAQTGYPAATGEEGTDYTDWIEDANVPKTSANQFGFPSNAQAALEYTYNGKKTTTSYPIPVIQVYPGKLVISKVFEGETLTDDQWKTLQEALAFELTLDNITYTVPFQHNFEKIGGIWSSKSIVTAKKGNESVQLKLTDLAPNTTYGIKEIADTAQVAGLTLHTEGKADASAAYRQPVNSLPIFIHTASMNNQPDGRIGRNETETYLLTNVYTPAGPAVLQDVRIYKISKESNSPLSQTEFVLSREKDGVTAYYNESDHKWVPEESGESRLTTEEDGNIWLPDLEAGYDYLITEKKAPAGYLLLKEAISVKVEAEGSQGKLILMNQDLGDDVQIDQDQKVITVFNSTGKLLPQTGGFGTSLYTFGGAAIVAAGLMYGFSRKRKQERGYR